MPHRPVAAVAFLARLPAPLHARAKEAAWRRRTSLNKLLTAALTAYLGRPRAPTKGGR